MNHPRPLGLTALTASAFPSHFHPARSYTTAGLRSA